MNKQRDPELNDRHLVERFFHAGPYTAPDLPIDEDGRIYHLQIKPGQIAPDILIVGDPGRVEVIGTNFLRDAEVEHEHRGLVTVTGISEISGKQATILFVGQELLD